MNINTMIGEVSASVLGPDDTAVISVDRYLTGAQLEVIGKHFERKLPKVRVVILGKGMSLEVLKAA